MVQIIKERTFGSDFGEALGGGISKGFEEASKKRSKLAELTKENDEIFESTGIRLRGTTDTVRKIEFAEKMKAKNKEEERAIELQKGEQKRNENQHILDDLTTRFGLEPGSLDAYKDDPAMAARVAKPEKEKAPLGGLGGTPLTDEEAETVEKIVKKYPKASAEELELQFNKAKIPRGRVETILESRRRAEEHLTKSTEDRKRALRQETLPLRTELANKAKIAEHSIRNKEQLLNLIKTGDINDPTYAAVAEALPLNLGKRLLSPTTLEYKGGLVEEYGDLKNIFSGATRVKEIDILEGKVADLYLTDEQKEAILRSRIKAEKYHTILAEAAAQLEDREDLGILQFEAEVEKLAKPKLDALFGQILEDHKAIIDSAERRQKSDLPLDPTDPDDKEILMQILQEAGGDKQEARKIAKKKGYKF
jgi:hypothetical protein